MESKNFDPAKELDRDTYVYKKETKYAPKQPDTFEYKDKDGKWHEINQDTPIHEYSENAELRPKYYKGKDGKDLFSRFENGLLSKEQVRGFYLGNIIKYITRYRGKNGLEDLLKADTYLNRLIEFEEHEEETE